MEAGVLIPSKIIAARECGTFRTLTLIDFLHFREKFLKRGQKKVPAKLLFRQHLTFMNL